MSLRQNGLIEDMLAKSNRDEITEIEKLVEISKIIDLMNLFDISIGEILQAIQNYTPPRFNK